MYTDGRGTYEGRAQEGRRWEVEYESFSKKRVRVKKIGGREEGRGGRRPWREGVYVEVLCVAQDLILHEEE